MVALRVEDCHLHVALLIALRSVTDEPDVACSGIFHYVFWHWSHSCLEAGDELDAIVGQEQVDDFPDAGLAKHDAFQFGPWLGRWRDFGDDEDDCLALVVAKGRTTPVFPGRQVSNLEVCHG